jgi:hypothetical protein
MRCRFCLLEGEHDERVWPGDWVPCVRSLAARLDSLEGDLRREREKAAPKSDPEPFVSEKGIPAIEKPIWQSRGCGAVNPHEHTAYCEVRHGGCYLVGHDPRCYRNSSWFEENPRP